VFNIELAEKVLRQITSDKRHHCQGTWISENSCGTSACIAGWTALVDDNVHVEIQHGCCYQIYDKSTGRNLGVVSDYARRALGLTGGQDEELFYTMSRLESRRKLARMIKEAKKAQRHAEEIALS
jgi:hypothetical protein